MPLGVILKNENIREEMLEILEILHKYVPYKNATGNNRNNQLLLLLSFAITL